MVKSFIFKKQNDNKESKFKYLFILIGKYFMLVYQEWFNGVMNKNIFIVLIFILVNFLVNF